ncbi:hypothetical protein HK414_02725 [Ramlibacter terrae]|uniref:Uncharacterized protein n=1 Tax=Ramlibacter terrae TaxID=2732511 RepID=A0ABX6P1S1_9BURK|nr:hypothetical protein HK414_02725 [Ramlibacter terrae]
MMPIRPSKPVTLAHDKTVAVQEDVRQAQADLHDANEVLADTVVGAIVTKESVKAALVQNLQVEGQLQDVVKELEVVTDLLKKAEDEKAERAQEDVTMAGRRSGEGVDSVIEHMSASARRKSLDR